MDKTVRIILVLYKRRSMSNLVLVTYTQNRSDCCLTHTWHFVLQLNSMPITNIFLWEANLDVPNHISGVMVRVLAFSVVDREFKSRSDKTKDCKIGICCFSVKHATLKAYMLSELNFFYIKSCQYSMFYTNCSWNFS